MPNGGWIALFVGTAIIGLTLVAWAWSKQKPPGYDISAYHQKRGKR